MPIRLLCPTCATQLVVEDGFADRAVKCPKCGAMIPASQAAPSPARSTPAAPRPAEALPAAEPTPAERPRAMPAPLDDSRKSSRDRAEESSNRERARRKERADRDDSDRPRNSSGLGLALAVVGVVLLSCCGGIGYGVYWIYTKTREVVNEFADQLAPRNERVTQGNYNRLNEGMPRAEVEAILGKGRVALPTDLAAVFRTESLQEIQLADWTSKAPLGRVMLWQNRDDYILVSFYPNADSSSRLQLKAFAPSGGAATDSGIADDDTFAQKHQLKRPDGTPGGPPITQTAGKLMRAFTDDPDAADRSYRDKLVELTDGILDRWEGDAALVYPEGQKTSRNRIRVNFRPALRPQFAQYQPGDSIAFRGKCEGRAGPHIVITRGEFVP